MDLSDLPQEVIEALAQYLSFHDVAACSAVNKQWRNSFNCNRVWKQFCKFHPNYFSQQKSKLGFPNSNAFDWCQAKEAVFKERFIQRNVKRGDYQLTEVKIGAFYCNSLTEYEDDARNHWLFVSCMKNIEFVSEHLIQVWNVNEVPTLHASAETPLGRTNRLLEAEIKCHNKKLFYIQDSCVLVYHFSYPQYEFKFLHKIELKVNLVFFPGIENFFETTFMTWCDNKIIGFYFSSYHTINSVAPFVHVWDEGGSLMFQNYDASLPLQSLSSSGSPFPLMKVMFDYSSKSVLLRYIPSNNQILNLATFNVETLQFTFIDIGNGFIGAEHFFISNDIVVFVLSQPDFNSRSLKCYTSSGQFLSAITLSRNGIVFPLLCIDNDNKDLVVLGYDQAILIDVLQGTQTSNFRVLFRNGDVANILTGSLLIIQGCKRKRCTDIWNYKSGLKLYSFHFSEPGINKKLVFSKRDRFPSKIIAFTNPYFSYGQMDNKDSNVVVIDFW